MLIEMKMRQETLIEWNKERKKMSQVFTWQIAKRKETCTKKGGKIMGFFFSSTSIFFSLQSFPYFSFPYPQLSSQTFICIYLYLLFFALNFQCH